MDRLHCTGLSACTAKNYLTRINEQTLCGFSDWRVPTIQELSSIAVLSKVLPAVDKDYFHNHSKPRYFSTEQRVDDVNLAWYVYFSDGSVSSTNKFDASSLRLVRGENKLKQINCNTPSSALELNEQTIVDKRTGLEWQRCNAEGGTANANDCKPINQQKTLSWVDALQYAENSTYAGHNDWRLPNKNELETLIDRGCSNPAIIADAFVHTVSDKHWTSSPNNFNPTFAWTIGFDRGEHAIAPKTSALTFRMVRDRTQ